MGGMATIFNYLTTLDVERVPMLLTNPLLISVCNILGLKQFYNNKDNSLLILVLVQLLRKLNNNLIS